MRADIREDKETTIARFLHGLNCEIRHEIYLRSFVELEEAVHLAIKIEKQHKMFTGSRFSNSKPGTETPAEVNKPEIVKPAPRNLTPAQSERVGASSGNI
ncbi:unnamed protein product [Linum trigynum]|uniref:Gag protein n=1 Tax=Linum trigynum TaxID=586398 RepID=A0AAV2GRN8_9ROSI